VRPELVLASRSPRRREILRRLGLAFSVQPGEVDEAGLTGKDPAELVERLALSKALDVAGTKERALVIGADTIVVLDGEVLGKPADSREAITMLERLQGRTASGIQRIGRRGGARGFASAKSRRSPGDGSDDAAGGPGGNRMVRRDR